MEHDLRDVRLAREDCRAHADEIHPRADESVDNGADGGSCGGLLRLARIVRDERQPREGHCNRQLKRHRKAHCLARRSFRRRARAAHDDGAEEHGEEKEGCHRDGVHTLDAQDTDANPDDDERADHETPDPMRYRHNTARRKRTVIDHDTRPANELQDVQRSKEESPPRAERHLDRLHRTAPRPRTDQPREEEQRAADHVTDNDCNAAVAKAKRRKKRARQNLRERDARTKPYQRVRAESCPLFHDKPPHYKTRPCQ